MKDFLKQLLETHTPSGYERFGNIRELTQNVLSRTHYVDNIGNLYFEKGSNDENAVKIFISAHYDENA